MSNSENMLLLGILMLSFFIHFEAISVSAPTTTTSAQTDTTTISPATSAPFKFILVSSIPTNAETVLFERGAKDYVVNEYYSLPPGLPTEAIIGNNYDQDYEFMTIDLLPSIINMSYLDAVNYVNRKCDELYGLWLTFHTPSSYDYGNWFNTNSSNPNNTVYWKSYEQCSGNIGLYENAHNITPRTYTNNWLNDIFMPFYETYLLFPISCIGIFFGFLNIRIFLFDKSSRNAFTALVFVQSLFFLLWTIFYDLSVYLQFCPLGNVYPCNAGRPLFGIMYNNYNFVKWLDYQFVNNIFYTLSYIFSFVIEMVRFYKIVIRVLALVAPIWYQNHISVKNLLIVCAMTAILSIVLTTIILLHWTYIGNTSALVIPNGCNPEIYRAKGLYLSFGWQCIPEYIVIDELFPLGLIVLILDGLVVYLLWRRLKQIDSKAERERERRMTMIALADGLYLLYDLIRRIFLVIYNSDQVGDSINQTYARMLDFTKYDIVLYDYMQSLAVLLIYMRNDFRSLIFTFDMIFCYIMLKQIQKLNQDASSSSSQNSTLFKKIKVDFLKKINGNLVATTNPTHVTIL